MILMETKLHKIVLFILYSVEHLKKKLLEGLNVSDIVITSGGVSMGEKVCRTRVSYTISEKSSHTVFISRFVRTFSNRSYKMN